MVTEHTLLQTKTAQAKWQLPTVANTNKQTRNQTKQNRKSYFFSCSFGEFQYFFTCFMQMIPYALSMFILVCSHATLSSAENSLEEILLQYEEYMNVNPDEEIQDSVIPLTSLIDERTLQAKAGKKETVLAELLEPAYRVCFHCR